MGVILLNLYYPFVCHYNIESVICNLAYCIYKLCRFNVEVQPICPRVVDKYFCYPYRHLECFIYRHKNTDFCHKNIFTAVFYTKLS